MKRTRVRSRSAKLIEQNYGQFVQDYLARHKKCEVGPIIDAAIREHNADFVNAPTSRMTYKGEDAPVLLLHRCRITPGGLHHLRKLSASGARCNPANVLACCNPCNGWVENFPKLAYTAGLVVREGDPSWLVLGERYWRDNS